VTPAVQAAVSLRDMTTMDWVGVAVATAIIFGILMPRLARDIRGWLAP